MFALGPITLPIISISEPAKALIFTFRVSSAAGIPTWMNFPPLSTQFIYGWKSISFGTVLIINSIELTAAFICSGSVLTTILSAPNFFNKSFFFSEVVKAVTCFPILCKNWIAIWPNPPHPITPVVFISSVKNFFIGLYVVIPAQNKGAAFSILNPSGRWKKNLAGCCMAVAYPPQYNP